MLIVIGRARARDGARDQLAAAAAGVATATREDEGCMTYTFAYDLTDPEVLVGVEVWRDQVALDAHMGHSHTKQFLAAVGDLVAGEPEMTFFAAEADGAVA